MTHTEYNLFWKHKKSDFNNSSDISRLGLKDVKNIEGKSILDVGCGVGRDMKFFKNAKLLVGIDKSNSIYIARKRLKGNNIRLYNIDLFDFEPEEKFDIVYSNGVLHHTPDAKKSFIRISSFVKKGGSLSVFLYHKYYPMNQKIAFWRRYLTRYMEAREVEKELIKHISKNYKPNKGWTADDIVTDSLYGDELDLKQFLERLNETAKGKKR